jgi:hypothetical protein
MTKALDRVRKEFTESEDRINEFVLAARDAFGFDVNNGAFTIHTKTGIVKWIVEGEYTILGKIVSHAAGSSVIEGYGLVNPISSGRHSQRAVLETVSCA